MKILSLCFLCVASLALGQSVTKKADVPTSQVDPETLVKMMARIGVSWSPSVSPDGKRIAFLSNLNGMPQVWTVPIDGGWPDLVTALDDQVTGVAWSPSGEWIALSVAPGGGMNTQIYVVRPDGTGLRRLTEGGKENNWLGVWTHDGRKLTIASSRRDPNAMDAYLADLTTGQMNLVSENKGIGFFTSVSRDGMKAILYRMASRSDNNLYLVDLTTRDEIHLTPHEGPGSFYGVISSDGQNVYLSTNKDRDLSAFARIKIGRDNRPGTIEIVAERKDAELESFDINAEGSRAALVWNVKGRNEMTIVDLRSLKVIKALELPAELVGGITFSLDGNLLAVVLSGSTSPRNIWALDLASGNFHQVTRSPHAGIDLSKLVKPELVNFLAHDGLQLSGWLYRPKGDRTAGPLVMSFHGGPEGQEQPGFSSQYQALLSQGIAVFAPNVRGSSGFGKRFVNLDNGKLRVDAIKDIKSCFDCVVDAGIADPKRIGILGGSYGGYMVMAGLTDYPGLFAAAANLYGVVNFETFFAQTEPWMAAISTIEYGDPKTESQMLKMLSPINKVDRVTTPTIVLHGANDTNVPVVEAKQVVESLKRRNVAVEFILFPDEGHGFTKTPNRIRANLSVVQWFDKYLKK